MVIITRRHRFQMHRCDVKHVVPFNAKLFEKKFALKKVFAGLVYVIFNVPILILKVTVRDLFQIFTSKLLNLLCHKYKKNSFK